MICVQTIFKKLLSSIWCARSSRSFIIVCTEILVNIVLLRNVEFWATYPLSIFKPFFVMYFTIFWKIPIRVSIHKHIPSLSDKFQAPPLWRGCVWYLDLPANFPKKSCEVNNPFKLIWRQIDRTFIFSPWHLKNKWPK